MRCLFAWDSVRCHPRAYIYPAVYIVCCIKMSHSKTSKVPLVSGVDFRCLADAHHGNRILGDDEWHQQQSIYHHF